MVTVRASRGIVSSDRRPSRLEQSLFARCDSLSGRALLLCDRSMSSHVVQLSLLIRQAGNVVLIDSST